MEFVRIKKDFDVVAFINLRDELFDDVYNVLHDAVRHYDNSRNYSIELYKIFMDFYSKMKIDFEINLEDFNKFKQLNFTNNDWMVIYKLFNAAIDYCDENEGLLNFVKLFYCDLILIGPFSQDFRSLDMSYELLELMSDEIKKLHWLFDDYFNNKDYELIKEIRSLCENDSVPFCVANHLAALINDNEVEQLDALYLYVAAVNKIYRRPVLYQSDLDNASSIRVSIDTSWHFSDDDIHEAFSKIEDWD